jgi:bis(5'-nucleosyl)-tetraphosphatase (symmetrical)
MRWVVGDVQGCARELEALLEAVRFDRGRDELVSVGDLVNKGPDSLAALRLWRDVGGRGVRGNHDVYALRAYAGRAKRRRSDTLQALFDAPDADELLGALGALPVLLRVDDAGAGTWVVHAGIHPGWRDLDAAAARIDGVPDDDPEVAFAMRVRCCTPEGEMSDHDGPPEDCPPPYRPWDELYRGDATIVHGHWAWRGHYRSRNVIGLDSGCVYGRELTAWCLEEDRVVQVPAFNP